MNIKKINNLTFGHIIKDKDLNEIIRIEDLINKNKLEAEQIIKLAVERAKEIELDTINQTRLRLQSENAELLETSSIKLNNAFQTMRENMSKIIQQALINFGVDSVSHNDIYKYVLSETYKFTGLQIIKIKGTPDFINSISSISPPRNDISILFEVDSQLPQNCCICETNFWIMQLDYNKTKQILFDYLNNISAHS